MLFPEFKELGLPELLTVFAGLGFILIIINYILNCLPAGLLKTTRILSSQNLEPISVIICAKNEDENLTEFLPKVLTQDYPNFEVIVVNDCSWDNTENVIDEFAKIFPNLKKVSIKEDAYYKHGKKFAILVGIKATTHNRMVFIDADCYPSSNQWLKEMAMGFAAPKEIILGYGAYDKQKGFLNKLIRFDTFMIATNYLSGAIKGKAYMGVGRNLAYTRDLFYKEKGFSNHYHINSGDDDLFVNQAATKENVNVVIDKNAITYSLAKKTFRDWRLQKARHLSTSPLYSPSSKTKIAFSYFSQYYFYFSLIALAFTFKTLLLIPIILLLKMIFQWIFLNKITKRLNEKDLLAGSVIYELILLFIYPIFHIAKTFNKPNKWTN
ncbi:MAG: glycosyltransferase [Bacteroidetes bacterium]|nr:glycosyltransferase [Bacteroidota bacterium]